MGVGSWCGKLGAEHFLRILLLGGWELEWREA